MFSLKATVLDISIGVLLAFTIGYSFGMYEHHDKMVVVKHGDVTCYQTYNAISCLPSERLVRVLNIYEPVPNRPFQVRLSETVLVVKDSTHDAH